MSPVATLAEIYPRDAAKTLWSAPDGYGRLCLYEPLKQVCEIDGECMWLVLCSTFDNATQERKGQYVELMNVRAFDHLRFRKWLGPHQIAERANITFL